MPGICPIGGLATCNSERLRELYGAELSVLFCELARCAAPTTTGAEEEGEEGHSWGIRIALLFAEVERLQTGTPYPFLRSILLPGPRFRRKNLRSDKNREIWERGTSSLCRRSKWTASGLAPHRPRCLLRASCCST